MDGNAIGYGIGSGLSSFFDAYKWLKTMEQQDRQEKDRYAWMEGQETTRAAREQKNIELRNQGEFDQTILRGMQDEDRERAKVASGRAAQSESETKFEAFVSQLPPQVQTILRAKKLGDVALKPEDLQTPEQVAAAKKTKADEDFAQYQRKGNFNESLVRGRPKVAPAGPSFAQRGDAEQDRLASKIKLRELLANQSIDQATHDEMLQEVEDTYQRRVKMETPAGPAGAASALAAAGGRAKVAPPAVSGRAGMNSPAAPAAAPTPASGPRTATMAEVAKLAAQFGITPDEMKQQLEARGVVIR